VTGGWRSSPVTEVYDLKSSPEINRVVNAEDRKELHMGLIGK
jgi:hypothetical protein